MSQENVELVREGFARWNEGDVRLLRFHRTDIEPAFSAFGP